MLEGEEMKILHICAGWQHWNGAANIARMIMDEQCREGHEVSFATWAKIRDLKAADEVWIHCGWLPCLWWAAFWAKNARWMPEACYDPIRLKFSAWKKRLAGPIERWSLRRCKKLVATCDAEKEWIEAYLGKKCPEIVVEDIKRFFDLKGGEGSGKWEKGRECGEVDFNNKKLNVLYLGRRHPLKGVEFLEAAVRQLQNSTRSTRSTWLNIELKIVSNAFGEELEKVWEWCDVLVLPTLSENFGLVVAEALERGKRVITTDGAPAWGEMGKNRDEGRGKRDEGREKREDVGERLVYLKGFRDGSEAERVRSLKDALMVMV